jgi:hypothetical protein
MSSSTLTLGTRRSVSVGTRTLEIAKHVIEGKRWKMNGDGTPIPVALRCATPLPFVEAQTPHDRAYDADEVWYYSPTNCVFIIKGDTVVTVTPANPSSLDFSSLVQCETCEEWTSLRETGTTDYRCTYCDSELTTLHLPSGGDP